MNLSFNNAHHFITIKLSHKNYLFWRTQITLFLKAQKLLGYVDGTRQRPHHDPTDPNYDRWIQQDTLIMSLLIGSLSEDVFSMVVGLETSHEIWTTLEKAFAAASPSNTHQSVEEGDQSVTQMDPGLYESARDGDIDVVRRQNMDQLQVQLTASGNTLLHVLALFHDAAECVDAILEMQSSTIQQSMLTRKNSKGETVLHIAASNGRFKIAGTLIEHAKTLDKQELESGVGIAKEIMRAADQNGDIALHLAVRNKHLKIVKLLVEEDPDFLHPSNKMEETPLYHAVQSHSHDMVDLILTACKSPPSKGPRGKTALHAAALNRCQDCIEKLVRKRAALTKEVDEFGWTPLHYAASLGLSDSVKTILDVDRCTAYIKADKDNNMTPLHVAACKGNSSLMRMLLKYCPDCWEMSNSKGQNVLHLAVDYQSQEALDFILDQNSWAGNLIKEKDVDGKPPIDYLYATDTSKNNLDGKRLVEHSGADTNVS